MTEHEIYSALAWPAIYYFYSIVRIMTRSRQAQGQGLHTMSCKSLILEAFQTRTNDLIDAQIKPNVGLSINQHQNMLPRPPMNTTSEANISDS